MIIRSYSGRNVAEALGKVKVDLGDQALIIETCSIRGPGVLAGTVGYEVVAALEHATPSSGSRPSSSMVSKAYTQQASPSQAAELQAQTATQSPSHFLTETSSTVQQAPLARELAAIRAELTRLASGHSQHNDTLGDLGECLRESELPTELCHELEQVISAAGDRLPVLRRRDFTRAWLSRALPCLPGINWDQARNLLVVGPTGVGKTTTIAKLAAELVHKQKKRIGIITIDTYRIGAQDQLRAYADLLDVPLLVAATPAQFTKALTEFSDRDHVLIDTAGRSPADAARVHELKTFCRAAASEGSSVAVALTIAATCGRAEFAAVIERFSLLPLTHTIVSKLDECAAPGRLYGCLRRHQLQISYLTTGQEVPHDIRPASAALIVDAMLDHAAVGSAAP